MASNLPGDICVGQHSVCIVRAAKLKPNCRPLGGVDSGFITAGIISATASPVLQEAQTLESINGCGRISFSVERPAQIRAMDVSGELTFFDHEMMAILFGGELVVGGAASDFVGTNIGWAAPNYTEDPPVPVYVEFIVKTVGEGIGDCGSSAGVPAAVGHIFGKANLIPGDLSLGNEVSNVSFSGRSVANPNLFDGPWNDWPGVGNIPNSPHTQVSYSLAEYTAIEDLAACGFATLPAGS